MGKKDLIITDVGKRDIKTIKMQCMEEDIRGTSTFIRPIIKQISEYVRLNKKLPKVKVGDCNERRS